MKLHSRAAQIGSAAWGWRRDGKFGRRLALIAQLLAGNSVTAVLSLVAFSVTARALGAAEYGILALIVTYARLIEQVVSFQSWQPVIKYGASLSGEGQEQQRYALFKFGVLLDLLGSISAWVAGSAIALLCSGVLGWADATKTLIMCYCFVLLFRVGGTPIAILRLSGRFTALACYEVAVALLRLTLCAVGLLQGWGLLYFTVVWAVAQALSSLVLVGLAANELGWHGVAGVIRAPLHDVRNRFPGIWSFACSSNLSLTIRSSAQQLDTLIVGALVGAEAAGLYHIAKRVGRLAQQVGVQVQAVLYPDVARLWAQGAVLEFKRAVLQVEILLAAFGVFLIVFFTFTAAPLLLLVAGASFVPAAPLLIAQSVAVTMTLSSAALRSALLAMGLQNQVLKIALVGTFAFYCTAFATIPHVGAIGANVAHVLLGMTVVLGMVVAFRRASRESSSS